MSSERESDGVDARMSVQLQPGGPAARPLNASAHVIGSRRSSDGFGAGKIGRVSITLGQLAERIGAELIGDPSVTVDAVGAIDAAGPAQVAFLSNPRYAKHLETTSAAAVIVKPQVTSDHVALLRMNEPYYGYAQAATLLHGFRNHPHAGVHPKAVVDPTASIGEGTILYPGVYVGPGAQIGAGCVLFANVVVYDDCVIGDRVTVHANTTIGADGFGFATFKGEHHKIPQVGNVVIEDDVEIGANCAIDRAAMGSTVIGRGTKLDKLVAIGHAAKVGEHSLLVAQTGVAGSATIGHHATIAGQCGIGGHLQVGDNVTIAARSMVINDVPDQTAVMGVPALPIAQARRVYVVWQNLPELLERVRDLEQQISELGTTSSNNKEV
jgi:UDP-3-O-[3-hydroxymyristoyl] glucosamine N-acyltransferase